MESVMCASERVSDAPDAPEMVRRARLLGQATARLIADIKVYLLSCLILISLKNVKKKVKVLKYFFCLILISLKKGKP